MKKTNVASGNDNIIIFADTHLVLDEKCWEKHARILPADPQASPISMKLFK